MKQLVSYMISILTLVVLGFSSCTELDPAPIPADPRQAFIGVWSVTETPMRLTYEVSIEADQKSENGGVYIYNFANAGSGSNPAYAFVSGTTISLEVNQVIGDNWVINGSGILSGTRINWPYTLNDGANLYNISAIFTKL